MLKKTKSISHTFRSLKPGKEYTFAVKPVAVIPAANYDKEKDEGEYPESFTIEGTMSEHSFTDTQAAVTAEELIIKMLKSKVAEAAKEEKTA